MIYYRSVQNSQRSRNSKPNFSQTIVFTLHLQATFPYEWQPKIVSCTVAKIGDLVIAAVPGEFTTMSGRRLRNVVKKASGAKRVVLAGLSNIYSDYIATYEEYQVRHSNFFSALWKMLS